MQPPGFRGTTNRAMSCNAVGVCSIEVKSVSEGSGSLSSRRRRRCCWAPLSVSAASWSVAAAAAANKMANVAASLPAVVSHSSCKGGRSRSRFLVLSTPPTPTTYVKPPNLSPPSDVVDDDRLRVFRDDGGVVTSASDFDCYATSLGILSCISR